MSRLGPNTPDEDTATDASGAPDRKPADWGNRADSPPKPDFAIPDGGRTSHSDLLAFAWRLQVVARRYKARADEAFGKVGFTHSRYEVLAAIELAPQGTTHGELARFMRVEGPTLVRLLDHLEKRGLVRRMAIAGDRRAKSVALTLAGAQLLARLKPIADSYRTDVFGDLSEDDVAKGTALLDMALDRLDLLHLLRD